MNGYYIAEILKRTNNIENISDINKNAKDEKEIKSNYNKIKENLEKLSVHIDNEKIKSIIKKEKGTLENILYKLKIQLERKKIGLDDILSRTQQFKKQNPQYDMQSEYSTKPSSLMCAYKTNPNMKLHRNNLLQPLRYTKGYNYIKNTINFFKSYSKYSNTKAYFSI